MHRGDLRPLAVAFILLSTTPGGLFAAQIPSSGIYIQGAVSQQKRIQTSIVASATTVENGLVCANIDFEGVGDLSPIPEFDGISSPDWLGIIDEDAGGSGNIAFEPSPETIAFWLGGPDGTGSSRDIVFSEPAAVVEFFYASAVNTLLQAFDESGALVATASGGANVNLGPGGDPNGEYNRWDRLRLDSTENRIVRIRVSGAVNRTGIDNLKVCRKIGVDTVEFTQAIQQIQDLEELKADLSDGEPPVPLVRNKPAVMRVYFEKVQAVTTLDVETIIGGHNESQKVTLQPNCDREKMRQRTGGCDSANFYFTPSEATLTVDLKIIDANRNTVESHRFQLRPRNTEPLVLGAVKVCDSRNTSGVWQCADNYYQRLSELALLLRKIAPTDSVQIVDTKETVRREMDADGDGTVTTGNNSNSEERIWWRQVAADIDRMFGLFDGLRDLLGLQDLRYHGMARSNLNGTILGLANYPFPSRGAVSRTSSMDLGQDVSQDTVAHETFHTLGRRHTNNNSPASNTAPGCSGLAADSATDWPFSDNRLRSGSGTNNNIEVGFDVAERRPLSSQNTFDIMSYCVPVWVSPHTYTRVLEEALDKSSEESKRSKATTEGSFWTVAGSLEGTTAKLDPIFELVTAGPTEEGSGTYRLQVRNVAGNPLFTRSFTPLEAETRVQGGGGEFQSAPYFSELVPVQTGAVSIAILDPAGRVVSTGALSGAAPGVTLTFPRGGEVLHGIQEISWQIVDPDSTKHTSWVQYSAEGGTLGSWQTLGFVTSNRLKVSFDTLPGTLAGGRSLIRVLVSDGAKTGTAVSAAFTVPTKGPVVEVVFPKNGAVFQSSETVWLQGTGFDAEDGALDQLTWKSDINGSLGAGASLPLNSLSPGTHRLALTGTDAEGKKASREIQVTVAGGGPTLDLQAVPLDTLPTTCVEVTLSVRAGSVPLRAVEYSLNGGGNWIPVSLSRLPFQFIVPGQGFFHLLARAFDVSGQLVAEDTRFFIDSACQSTVPPPPAGEWLTTRELPGFRFKAQITSGDTPTPGVSEPDCIGETLCISGNLPGRSELFTRIIGPRPNGRLWVNIVRFTTSEVEVWIEQPSSGQINYYRLPSLPRESSELTGLVDKEAFVPGTASSRVATGLRSRVLGDPGVALVPLHALTGERMEISKATTFTSPEFPGYRFHVRILSNGDEVEARREGDCLSETVCISGAIPGRSELFLRLIGPRPNGFLWVNLVRFTTSRVEVEVEQTRTGRKRSYILPEIPRDSSSLDGLVDKEAFLP